MEIKDVIQFMIKAHSGQFYGDLPFCVHPMLVARHFDDPPRKTIALLHDVVEDTSYTIEAIRELFSDEIADAIDALSRRADERYEMYIIRLATNDLAKQVKIADLEENLHSAKHCYPEYSNLIKRYTAALKYLTDDSVY